MRITNHLCLCVESDITSYNCERTNIIASLNNTCLLQELDKTGTYDLLRELYFGTWSLKFQIISDCSLRLFRRIFSSLLRTYSSVTWAQLKIRLQLLKSTRFCSQRHFSWFSNQCRVQLLSHVMSIVVLRGISDRSFSQCQPPRTLIFLVILLKTTNKTIEIRIKWQLEFGCSKLSYFALQNLHSVLDK